MDFLVLRLKLTYLNGMEETTDVDLSKEWLTNFYRGHLPTYFLLISTAVFDKQNRIAEVRDIPTDFMLATTTARLCAKFYYDYYLIYKNQPNDPPSIDDAFTAYGEKNGEAVLQLIIRTATRLGFPYMDIVLQAVHRRFKNVRAMNDVGDSVTGVLEAVLHEPDLPRYRAAD